MRTPATVIVLLVTGWLAACGGDEPTATAPVPSAATSVAEQTEAVRTIGVEAAAARTGDGEALLVDVREDDEWRAGHAPDAVHVPLADVADRVGDLDERRDGGALIFICRSGNRSAEAARTAQAAGLQQVYSVDGGMGDWVSAGLPLEPADGSVL